MGEFVTKDFGGSVILKEWVRWHDGRQFIGFTGRVSILQDEELVGFRVKGTESNWVARVDGATESINILGCQVRAVHVHEGLPTTSEWLAVP